MQHLLLGSLVLVTLLAQGAAAALRDNISIVGSSTVYPFATVVAERFARSTRFRAPRVEATGSGGGLKLFCRGVGASTPDITNASRRIKRSEFEDCQANGVATIVEVLVGYDGIVIANSVHAERLELSLRDLFLALAKDIPGADGRLIPNPHKTWQDVNAALPARAIEVLGPPPTSGTRDAFVELAMGGGARTFSPLKALYGLGADRPDEIRRVMATLGLPGGLYDALRKNRGRAPAGKDIFKVVAYALREDGAYIEAGENDNLIVQKLEANPAALGIFGFSFLDENGDKVQGSVIDGVNPGFETIGDGSYPVSRPLYFYIKGAHVDRIPGIREYAREFVSNRAVGPEGYLPQRGLTPLPPDKLIKMQETVREMRPLRM